MARDKGPFSLDNPWPRVGWGALAVILGISLVLGFVVLSRYQQNGRTTRRLGRNLPRPRHYSR